MGREATSRKDDLMRAMRSRTDGTPMTVSWLCFLETPWCLAAIDVTGRPTRTAEGEDKGLNRYSFRAHVAGWDCLV